MAMSRQNVVVCDNGTGVSHGPSPARLPIHKMAQLTHCVTQLTTLLPPVLTCVPVRCLSRQYVKAGFAGDNFPSAMFPAMVGRPMMRSDQVGDMVIKVRGCHVPCRTLSTCFPDLARNLRRTLWSGRKQPTSALCWTLSILYRRG
jgi:hypothetical protein